MKLDLIKDSPGKLFLKYLIPALGSALVVSVYAFIDTIAVGQGVGYQGTAALAVDTPLFQIAAFFGILCGMGAGVLISMAQGSHEHKKIQSTFKASVNLMILFSVGITLLFWIFKDPIYQMLGSSESISSYVHGYGDLLILIFPLMMFCAWCPFICRADKNPNLPLYSTLIGGSFNIFGDWFFVFPMKMGIFGAILATAIGYLVQALVLAFHFISKKNTFRYRDVHSSTKDSYRIIQCGFGTAFLEVALVAATVLMNNQIQAYMDESALAIYGVLLTVSALFSHMFMGIGQAASPILSANLGAAKPKRILEVQRYTMITTGIFSILFFACGWFFPDEIIILFVKSTPEIMAISKPIVQMYFVSFLFLGINTVIVYVLQSLEQNMAATILTMLRGIVLIFILLYTLPLFFGSIGIWYSVILNDLIIAMVSLYLLWKSDRKFHRLANQ